jgi:hypothetical protein
MANQSSNDSIDFPVILFLVFMVLKLTDQITWSWWWVTAPLWGGFALYIIVFIVAVIVFLLSKIK